MHFARFALLICSAGLLGAGIAPATQPTNRDPIRQMLWGRKDIFGSSYPYLVDAPLEGDPHYLIDGDSHAGLMLALDHLLSRDVNLVAPNPRARALMQHELWQVFDYTIKSAQQPDEEARDELRKKLVGVMRKLALTRHQIEELPDDLATSAGSDAAPNVEDHQSGWVGRGDMKTVDGQPPSTLWAKLLIAPTHTEDFQGRSVFGVFIRFADGPKAAEGYLQRLSADPAMTMPTKPGFDARVYDLPQFPVGTRLALLRKMILIDRDGTFVCSPIVQSLQVRTFLKIGSERTAKPGDVRMQEFVLDRDRYVAGEAGAMHAIAADEFEPGVIFPTAALSLFGSSRQGLPQGDFRPAHPRLSECYQCHSHSGVLSVNSFDGLFKDTVNLKPYTEAMDAEIKLTIRYREKMEQDPWGMLQKYWKALPG